jgi:hypothetical protein
MIKKSWDFICEKGYVFMTAGVVIVAVAGVALFMAKQSGQTPGLYLWPTVSFGLGVYIFGRLGVYFKNAGKARKALSADQKSDE